MSSNTRWKNEYSFCREHGRIYWISSKCSMIGKTNGIVISLYNRTPVDNLPLKAIAIQASKHRKYSSINQRYLSMQIRSTIREKDGCSLRRRFQIAQHRLTKDMMRIMVENELLEYDREKASDCVWVSKLLKWQGISGYCDEVINEFFDRIELHHDGPKVRLNLG